MSVKGRYKEIEHGTYRGYAAHRRREKRTGERDHCYECLKGHNLHTVNRRRADKGLEPLTADLVEEMARKPQLKPHPKPTKAGKQVEAVNPNIVPFDVLIIGDVIDVQVSPAAKPVRAVVEGYREEIDGSVKMFLSMHRCPSKKATPRFSKRRAAQGFYLVPASER